MTYQVLARKWRPQDFASLIGQDEVVTALRNALADGRLAQAYLFSGIRGVGKTTAARLLAKALNCETGPTPDPCNDCRICRDITAGSDLDVLEIDAATYSKVEQVRELTESLRYGPARDRFKVVILDEVHRLSRQAFDALLKIVEEPPPHLVFVFATTEIEAVPATVLSRCQEFHFRRVATAILSEHLAAISAEEGIEASTAALRLVARAGDGSVRDAVALLDQLATYGGGAVSDEAAARLLGSFDPDLFFRLLDGILGGRSREVSDLLTEVEREGWDPRQLFARFLAYCRDALHLSLGAVRGADDLPAEEGRRLRKVAESAGKENLLRVLHHLLGSEAVVRRSDSGALALEVALLRAAELPKLVRVEEVLAGGGANPAPGNGSEPAGPGGGGSESRSASSSSARTEPAPTPPARSSPPPRPAPTSAPDPPAEAGSPTPPPDSSGDVEAFLASVSRRRQALAAHLGEARDLRFVEGKLVIVRPPGDEWIDRALRRRGNRRALEEALAETWGPDAEWLSVVSGETAADDADDTATELPKDPVVQTVLDIFNGTIQAVEPRASAEEDDR